MPRRSVEQEHPGTARQARRGLRRLIAAAVGAGVVVAVGTGAAGRADAVAPATVGPRELWAFCGVRPSDPSAERAAYSMAHDAGVTATFGPCDVPSRPYTPAETADRYVDPDTYRQLVGINARAGMKTLVYDRRIWSEDAATRDGAIAFWAPVLDDIAAWDMGDEFPPDSPYWQVLVARWAIVTRFVTPRTGIAPYTNHVVDGVERALVDLPGSDELVSFDHYNDADMDVAAFVRTLDGRVRTVMCGVNALTHLVYVPTPTSVADTVARLTAAGCDRFLVFGGERVYDTEVFGTSSLVDADGRPTPLAAAFLAASGRVAAAPDAPASAAPSADAGTRPAPPTAPAGDDDPGSDVAAAGPPITTVESPPAAGQDGLPPQRSSAPAAAAFVLAAVAALLALPAERAARLAQARRRARPGLRRRPVGWAP